MVLTTSVVAFVQTGVMAAMTRDTMAVQRGEWWRIVTPTLVQPSGALALAFLLIGFVVLIPVVARQTGNRTAAAAMVVGAVGALAISSWLFPAQTGGGSSGAVAALVGAWACCLTRNATRDLRARFASTYSGFFATYLLAAATPFATVAPLIGNLGAVAAYAVHRSGRPRIVAVGILACGVAMTALLDEHGFGLLLGAAMGVWSSTGECRALLVGANVERERLP
ncbi:MAG: rhomboid family intramembrane serine protease [Micropruina sp.]|uniref:hypothetical protein n=1 Tax=Micropruina sp. TaxID=2737536 RepID=UPI0039E691AC